MSIVVYFIIVSFGQVPLATAISCNIFTTIQRRRNARKPNANERTSIVRPEALSTNLNGVSDSDSPHERPLLNLFLCIREM